MPKKPHLWITLSFHLPLAVFICENCQGVKVRDRTGKFHYFYQGTTQHC